MKLGFIGLGIMGKPMAKNLLASGYPVLVHNRSKGPMEELAAVGAIKATLAEIGGQCDVIFTMLPNGPDVEKVVLSDGGLAEYMRSGSVLIDMSSINPIVSKNIAKVLEERGVEMLDAPVSGGEAGAIAGTLSFMVGGRAQVFEKYAPLLKYMGSSVVRCGEIGTGNTTKLANQIIVAVNIAAVSEAFMLVKKAGVDPELAFRAIKGGLAGSAIMEAKVPMLLSGNDRPGFKLDLHIKDLNNAIDAGHEIGSPMLLSSSVMEMMRQMHADGLGQCDHSVIARYYEKLTGLSMWQSTDISPSCETKDVEAKCESEY